MNTQTPLFVGYGTLEALLQSHAPGTPLYAVLASETAPGQFGGAQVVSLVLVVEDVQNGVARQWRRTVGRLATSPSNLCRVLNKLNARGNAHSKPTNCSRMRWYSCNGLKCITR